MKEELFRDVLKILCSSKILTVQEITNMFKTYPTEIEILISALVSEGFLTRVEAGSVCPCDKCLLKSVCSIKRSSESYVASTTYYRLSESGIRLCKELQTRSSESQENYVRIKSF